MKLFALKSSFEDRVIRSYNRFASGSFPLPERIVVTNVSLRRTSSPEVFISKVSCLEIPRIFLSNFYRP